MSPLSRISPSGHPQTDLSHNTPIRKTETLYESCITSLGGIIRDTYFMPLFNKLPPEWQLQLEKEEEFFLEFWNAKASLRPEFPLQKDIRNHFICKTEKIAVTVLGKKLWVKCLIIESKNHKESDKFYNFVHVLGNSSTIDSNIAQTYPFLASYLTLKQNYPARFILISQYNIESRDKSMPLHKIKTLQEGGFILSETLKSLEETCGTIHQIFAHSLGCMIAAASLQFFHKITPQNTVLENNPLSPLFQKIYKTFTKAAEFFIQCYEFIIYSLTGKVTKNPPENPPTLKAIRTFKSLPKNIHFDRGPSCIKELSKERWGGSLFKDFARMSGWDLDLGKEIFNFVQNTKENLPPITFTNALQDHIFNGKASLVANPYIQRLTTEKKVTSLVLDITQQCIHSSAHHSLHAGALNRLHLIEESSEQNFLQGTESLSDAIIRKSMPPSSQDPFIENLIG